MSEQRPWLRITTLIAVVALVASACGAQATPTPGVTPIPATPTPPGETPEPYAGDEWDAGCDNYVNKLGEIDHVTAKDRYTVEIGLCRPDASFLSKIAFVTGGIMDKDWLAQVASDPAKPYLDQPNGTGPLLVKAGDWVKGDHVTLTRFDNYWGADKAKMATYVVRWGDTAAQRLLELQSGAVDGIDNVGPTDYQAVQGDANLKLFTRQALNVLYLGMNNLIPPFDNEKVRQAIAMGLDRERMVDNFYPAGTEVASHFTPCSILGGCEGEPWYAFDKAAAQALLAEGLAEAGMTSFPKMNIYYRTASRAYLPNPPQFAVEFQTQLRDNLGIDASPVELESGTMVTNFNNGLLDGFFLFGWLQDWPDQTDWLDIHFSRGVLGFGDPFLDLTGVISVAGQVSDENQRKSFYATANNLIRQHVPMVPIAHAASAVAFKATVEGAYADPNTEERYYVMNVAGQDQLTFMQGAEPLSLFPADESDGESLRFGNQIYQPLYDFELGGVKPVPALAESCTVSADNLTWTCTLRQGVTFHNGADFDANDVVATFKMLIDAADPNHKGNTGDFYYSYTMWGELLNPPPPAPAS